MDWLHGTITSLAERAGLDASAIEPSPSVRRALLDVARVAAHTSGDRTNAPLLCYVLGRAEAAGANLDEMIEIVRAQG
jgi:hypothetical protein